MTITTMETWKINSRSVTGGESPYLPLVTPTVQPCAYTTQAMRSKSCRTQACIGLTFHIMTRTTMYLTISGGWSVLSTIAATFPMSLMTVMKIVQLSFRVYILHALYANNNATLLNALQVYVISSNADAALSNVEQRCELVAQLYLRCKMFIFYRWAATRGWDWSL